MTRWTLLDTVLLVSLTFSRCVCGINSSQLNVRIQNAVAEIHLDFPYLYPTHEWVCWKKFLRSYSVVLKEKLNVNTHSANKIFLQKDLQWRVLNITKTQISCAQRMIDLIERCQKNNQAAQTVLDVSVASRTVRFTSITIHQFDNMGTDLMGSWIVQ